MKNEAEGGRRARPRTGAVDGHAAEEQGDEGTSERRARSGRPALVTSIPVSNSASDRPLALSSSSIRAIVMRMRRWRKRCRESSEQVRCGSEGSQSSCARL